MPFGIRSKGRDFDGGRYVYGPPDDVCERDPRPRRVVEDRGYAETVRVHEIHPTDPKYRQYIGEDDWGRYQQRGFQVVDDEPVARVETIPRRERERVAGPITRRRPSPTGRYFDDRDDYGVEVIQVTRTDVPAPRAKPSSRRVMDVYEDDDRYPVYGGGVRGNPNLNRWIEEVNYDMEDPRRARPVTIIEEEPRRPVVLDRSHPRPRIERVRRQPSPTRYGKERAQYDVQRVRREDYDLYDY